MHRTPNRRSTHTWSSISVRSIQRRRAAGQVDVSVIVCTMDHQTGRSRGASAERPPGWRTRAAHSNRMGLLRGYGRNGPPSRESLGARDGRTLQG